MEHWKPVPNYEGLYEVSDHGRVRGVFHRILKPGWLRRGYRRVTLCKEKQHEHWTVHRLVARAFIGACPPRYVVNHKDGNPSNNALDNLEYVTHKENHQHSWRELGRQPPHRGETTHFAKLTDSDVIQIRRMRSEGMTYSDIAAHFNTKPANVWHICMGRTWKHLL